MRHIEPLLPYTRTIRAGTETDVVDWVAGRSILAFGVRIGIRTNQPEILDRLSEYFPPLWKPTPVSHVERLFSLKIAGAGLAGNRLGFHELFEDLEPGTRSRSLNTVLEAFESRVKMYVAEMAPRRVFVHAGAVGWRGQAIIIPGRSMSGKTSLVTELVRAGATYYSDEYAVLDLRGRIHPYPQPLAIRDQFSFKQRKCRVEEIGGVTGRKPLPVGLVVVSKYKSGVRWSPRQLSGGRGVLELLANTVPARRNPDIVMTTLQEAVSEAKVVKGARGEAAETAAMILKQYGEREGQAKA
jgi:hypothetical protein